MKLGAMALALLLSAAAAFGARTREKDAKKPAAPGSPTYEMEVARLKGVAPETEVFKRLRAAYAASSRFDPYGKTAEKDEEFLSAALDRGDFEKAAALAEGILEKNYTRIDIHKTCDFIYKKLGQPRATHFHRFVAFGLLEALFDSGDGKSFDTAFRVIQFSEEKDVLDTLGLEKTRQALALHGGRRYDRLGVRDEKGVEQGDVYFDVEPLLVWFEKSLAPAK